MGKYVSMLYYTCTIRPGHSSLKRIEAAVHEFARMHPQNPVHDVEATECSDGYALKIPVECDDTDESTQLNHAFGLVLKRHGLR